MKEIWMDREAEDASQDLMDEKEKRKGHLELVLLHSEYIN